MVFVAEVKGNWYVYRSYREPGCEYPLHEYLGPASDYPGGQKLVARKRKALAEKAERKKRTAKELDYIDGESGE